MSKNDFFNETPILLPTRSASSGATVNKTEYVIVDGMTPYIYVFSFCGVFMGAVPTLRPYKKITYSMETDSYYALGCGCDEYVYTLNCRFVETDKINIDYAYPILDLSLLQSEQCAESLVLTAPHSVGLFTHSGNREADMRVGRKNTFYISYVKTSSAQAEGFSKGNDEYININAGCDENYIPVPSCVSLKNLFATDGGGIYGFFSKNYAYNFIVPLYENDTVNYGFFKIQTKNN